MKKAFLFFLFFSFFEVNSQIFTSAFQGSLQTPLRIGDSYKGGKIGYVFVPGDSRYVSGEFHGIIISNTELTIKWTNNSNAAVIAGATSQAIGDGLSNTNAIVQALGNNPANTYAALEAYNYSIVDNGITYDDWFLPSYLELVALKKAITLIGSGKLYTQISESGITGTGNFTQAKKSADSLAYLSKINNPLDLKMLPTTASGYIASIPRYWSSTDFSINAAYSFRFYDAAFWNNQSKTFLYKVRFARYF